MAQETGPKYDHETPPERPDVRPLLDERWLDYQYWVLEKSSYEIAAGERFDQTTVSNRLRGHNIPTRSNKGGGHEGRTESLRDYVNACEGSSGFRKEEHLRELYVEKGLSIKEIANQYDVHRKTVWDELHKHDIGTRPSLEEAPMFYVREGNSWTYVGPDDPVDAYETLAQSHSEDADEDESVDWDIMTGGAQ